MVQKHTEGYLQEESSISPEDTNTFKQCSQRWEDEQKHNINLRFEFGDKLSEYNYNSAFAWIF